MSSDNRAIKLKGLTLHTPTSYSTIDDAVYVRVVSFSTGGQNFRVANDASGNDIVARYAVSPRETIYIKKEPGQYLGGGSSSLRCSSVSVEG
jgi:hypothetical protein|tara:strand:- start:313 stop:588 length:276 start_codon:yes stop_codon:yes gene_type:complete